MATSKPLLGLGMAIVLLGIAGARLGFLYRVSASVQPAETGHVGWTGDITRTDEALALSPDLDDVSSSGATPSTTSKQ